MSKRIHNHLMGHFDALSVTKEGNTITVTLRDDQFGDETEEISEHLYALLLRELGETNAVSFEDIALFYEATARRFIPPHTVAQTNDLSLPYDAAVRWAKEQGTPIGTETGDYFTWYREKLDSRLDALRPLLTKYVKEGMDT